MSKAKVIEVLTNPIFENPNACWVILRRDYPSFKKRQVIYDYKNNKENLLNWLVDCGFDVEFNPNRAEEIRFKKGNLLGIIYCSGKGNLLAHKLCEIYDEENG